MGTIRVHTANERIIFDNKPIITSGNKNINDINVTFCDRWLSLGENTEYWAVFFKDEKEIHKRKLENGKCLIPNEVLTKKGWFYFGFYSKAENGEKVKTSKIAEFEVMQGVPTEETANGDESTDSGNAGGGSSGNTGGNIDLSNYVTKDEMPEIDVDEFVERTADTENHYSPLTDTVYWKEDTTIDPIDGSFKASVYPTCVTPEIYVVNGGYYKVEGGCYESDVYQYGFDGALVEVTSLINNGVFKVCDNAATIRLVVPKVNYSGVDLDLVGTIEHFNGNFKLYICDKYKLKDNVQLPDNIKIPESDFVLTEEDKAEIAEMVAELVEVPEGGNTDTVDLSKYVTKEMFDKELYITSTQETTQGIVLEWSEGYWDSREGTWIQSTRYNSTQYFACETFPEITKPELLTQASDTIVSLRKNNEYVGFWMTNKYYTPSAKEVSSLDFDSVALCIRNTTDYKQVELVGGESTEVVIRKSRIENLEKITAEVETRREKTYYLFGDSITYWDSRTSWYDGSVYMVAYPSYIRDVLGVNIVNCGVTGNTASAITSRLKSTDLTDAYAVTYMAGTNDVQQNVSIENFTASLEQAVEYVCTNYPQVKFYFLSPLYTDRGDIKPYAEAMQTVADKYSVPILRWDKVSQINEFNKSYYTVEGLHPNNIGYKAMANSLIPFLRNN